ncbi:MAG: prepilin-type N-terminal cleavage/methylation domain-containing protein [Alphaproteobacteria bacterium]|jgi:prepilin-type N-terminal cleavage/methylation domain-containing protein|nr:prepilin-type N-terminal cleavage/methylation domain-containing protein [Alphaproteobacteria bacterium]
MAPGQAGMTLIEVLVGIVMTSILVLGLTGLWTTVNNEFLFLTVKQKAIFVLHGEMTRLTSLFRYADVAADSDYRQVTYSSNSLGDEFSQSVDQTRYVYMDSPTLAVVQEIVNSNSNANADFSCGAAGGFDPDCAGVVLVDTNGVGNDDDRNYVWIDMKRRITGRLSWELSTIPNNANTCYNPATDANGACADLCYNGSCQLLTLFLQYPFRYTDSADPDTDAGFNRTQSLILKTIVGRR